MQVIEPANTKACLRRPVFWSCLILVGSLVWL